MKHSTTVTASVPQDSAVVLNYYFRFSQTRAMITASNTKRKRKEGRKRDGKREA
jgi:hypothetical protein